MHFARLHSERPVSARPMVEETSLKRGMQKHASPARESIFFAIENLKSRFKTG